MFLITSAEDQAIQLVAGYARDGDSIVTWSGYFHGAKAVELTPGTIIKDWSTTFIFDEPGRSDLIVVKRNRVSIVVQRVGTDGIAYGPTATVRIDR